jgi:polysaccharide biosynthesis/export protein
MKMLAILLFVVTPWLVATPTAHGSEFVIGTDDVLHIIVWDHKELEQQVVVRPDGKISYPLAGEIDAKGRTVPELTAALTEKLGPWVKNPNVSVMVKEIRSFRVHVLGRVAQPGVYPIKVGTPLLHALTLAGGTTDGADLPSAYVIRGDTRIPVNLRRLIQAGDLSLNMKLETEDTIVVPEIAIGTNPQELPDRRIYVLGNVARPGVYNLKDDVPLLHALFLAGGLAEGADMAAAFIVRGNERITADLWRLIQQGDLSQNHLVTHEDMIVVPSGGELQNAVYVMGEVQRPGVYSQPDALTLLKVVSLAGGFTRHAASNRLTLIRKEGGNKTMTRINIGDIMRDPQKNPDIALRPGDVVVVPERLF